MQPAPAMRPRPESGFTLIEVVVALAVLAIGLYGFFSAAAGGMARGDHAEAMRIAAMLAESKLAAIGIETPLAEGETAGAFAGGQRWRVAITPFARATDEERAAVKPWEVRVSVAWGAERKERSVTLTTLLLGPAP